MSSQSQDIDGDEDDNVCSSEETSENHGRIRDLHSESEVTGISTIATVTPTANNITKCTSQCCLNYNEAFQPVSKVVLNTLSSKGRNFLPQWYKYNLTTLHACSKVMHEWSN